MPEKANTATAHSTDRRFDRVMRLFGEDGLRRLQNAHVMVIGCGGVGSWAAEALARTAVGRVTLVDGDAVCIRNFNRQLQAVEGSVGKFKAELLAARLMQINPRGRMTPVAKYFTQENAAELMADRPDFVIDAIDHVTTKCFLINYCRENAIPLVVSTGSGGRLDPTQIRTIDLGLTELDPLARAIRKILRGKYAFPKKGKFGIESVCSLEDAAPPQDAEGESDCKHGGCLCPFGENEFQSCTRRNLVLGTAVFVTAAFGMACASLAARRIAGETP